MASPALIYIIYTRTTRPIAPAHPSHPHFSLLPHLHCPLRTRTLYCSRTDLAPASTAPTHLIPTHILDSWRIWVFPHLPALTDLPDSGIGHDRVGRFSVDLLGVNSGLWRPSFFVLGRVPLLEICLRHICLVHHRLRRRPGTTTLRVW